jgi:benzodiazapine receptor
MTATSSDKIRAALVLVATIATIAFNGLASTGSLNGVMTDEVSNRYSTVITPAGFTFSIWAAIYLGLLGFSIYQLLPSKNEVFRSVRTLFIATCVLNCVWLWFWHQYQLGICVVIIIALASVLFLMNLRFKHAATISDAIFGKGIFGLYFGWVTAASLVNTMIFLVYAGVEMSATAWKIAGIFALVLAAGFAVIVRFKLRNYLYPLAIAWAATGIAVKQSGNTSIVVASAFCVIVGLVMAVSFVMDQKSTTT